MRKSKQDWVNLIQEFEGSDLKQTEFCKAQGLNPKYFSLKRSRLLQPNKTSGFVKVSPQSVTTMSDIGVRPGTHPFWAGYTSTDYC